MISSLTFVATIGGWFADKKSDIAANIVASVLQRWVDKPIDALEAGVAKALAAADGRLPKNHDLELASKHAFAISLLILAQAIGKEERHVQAGTRFLNKARVTRLKNHAEALSEAIKHDNLTEAQNDSLRRFAEILKLSQGDLRELGTAGKDASIAQGKKVDEPATELDLSQRFHNAVIVWLDEEFPETGLLSHLRLQWEKVTSKIGRDRHRPIIQLEDYLSEFPYTPPDPGFFRRLFRKSGKKPLQISLFSAWSQCFFELVKGGERSFRAYILDVVQELGKDIKELGPRLNGRKLEKQLETSLMAMTGLQYQMLDLMGLTKEGFASVGGELTVLTSLAEDEKEQLELLSGKLESFHRTLEALSGQINELHQLPFRDKEQPVPTKDKQASDVPIRYLVYRRQWIEHLHGREAEMQELCNFVENDEKFLWWGIVGEAGVGKSRVAFELVLKMRQRGWRAGFLERGRPFEVGNSFAQWRPSYDTLIVVDNAYWHGADLVHALARLSEAAKDKDYTKRLRILLLDRPGALKPLFSERAVTEKAEEKLLLDDDKSRAAKSCYSRTTPEIDAREEEAFGEIETLLSLDTLPENGWDDFLRAVAVRSGVEPSVFETELDRVARGARGTFDNLIRKTTKGGRPLLLQLFGLAMAAKLQKGELPDYSRPLALIDEMLTNEIRLRWAPRFKSDPDGELLTRLQKAVALTSMCRGLTLDTNLSRVLREKIGFDDERDRELFKVLREILGFKKAPGESAPNRHLNYFEPDLLAEHFVVRGGISPHDDELGLPAPTHPFNSSEILNLAMSISPEGVADFLYLLVRDYPTESLPLVKAAIAAVPEPVIDWDVLPKPQGTSGSVVVSLDPFFANSPLWSIWQATIWVVAFGLPLDDLGINEAFLDWSSTPSRQLVCLAGAVAMCQVWSDYGYPLTSLQRGPEAVVRSFAHADYLSPHCRLLVCFYAVKSRNLYLETGDKESVTFWDAVIEDFAGKSSGDEELELMWARGAVNIMSSDLVRDADELEHWGGLLQAAVERNPAHQRLKPMFTSCAVNATAFYAKEENLADLERWGQMLLSACQSDDSRDDPEIQSHLMTAAVNIITAHKGNKDWEQVEHWGQVLHKTANLEACRNHSEIRLEFAIGARRILTAYGSEKDWEGVERWGQVLRQVAAENLEDSSIQFELATGAFNTLTHCLNANEQPVLEDWAQILEDMASWPANRRNPAVQNILANGAVNAISFYARSHCREKIEYWGKTLRKIADANEENRGIVRTLAMGTCNAILFAADAGNALEIEQWANYLVGKLPDRLTSDDEAKDFDDVHNRLKRMTLRNVPEPLFVLPILISKIHQLLINYRKLSVH